MDDDERALREQAALRNRLTIATGLWRRITEEPLPKMEPGDPREQVKAFEMRLIEVARQGATPETAKQIAEGTWDLVHSRPIEDEVRQQVEKLHAELAYMAHGPESRSAE